MPPAGKKGKRVPPIKRKKPTGTLSDPVTAYARRVLAGREIACQFVKQACRRHLTDLKRDDIYLDLPAVHKVMAFMRLLPHVQAGKANKKERFRPEPAQEFIIGSVFGWKKKKDGNRRFNYAYIEIPRKNGKSFLASGVALYGLLADGEEGAEIYAIATKMEQAKKVFNPAKRMVSRVESFKRRVQSYRESLFVESTFSSFAPLPADAETLDGLNPHITVVDEYEKHPNSDLYDVIDEGMGAREQPLIFTITTAGSNRNSACYRLHSHVVSVLEPDNGYEDDTIFGYIATIDKGDDFTDPKVWKKANFLLGCGKNEDAVSRGVHQAKQIPGKKNSVLNKQFNIWTDAQELWLSMEKWDKGKGAIDPRKLKSERCVVGIDLSSNTDLTCISFLFPPGPYDEWVILPFFYLPEENLKERIKRDKVPYDLWIERGYIHTTDGDCVDLEFVEAHLLKLSKVFDIIECGFDSWGALKMGQNLEKQGFQMVVVPQTFGGIGPATSAYERMVLRNEFRHGGHPVLRWMMTNVALRHDANNNFVPDKKKSTMRIDGVAATITGLSRALTIDVGPSRYENEKPMIV